MKKIWTGALVAAMCVPVLALAAEVRVGEQPSLAANERITDDFYIAGGNVSSAGVITGDLVAAGGNVVVNSAVTQDVIVGGGSVTILGTVGDDIRVGGGNIMINGRVGGDVVVGGGQTQISGAGVGGDVLWGGGTLRIEAPVAGDLKLGGGNVYINAPIRGNVEFMGEKLTLGSAAVIQGNLTYTSPEEAVMEEGAVVRGATDYTKKETKAREAARFGLAAFLSIAILMKFLMLFASALVVGLIFQRYAVSLVNSAVAQPLMGLGRGFAVLVLTPIASIILLITVLGVPLGILGLIAFAGMIVFASILVPILLGSLVHKWVMKPAGYEVTWLTILIGAVLATILGWIPIVGWIVKFAVLLVALGVAMKMKWDIAKNWR
ncbi:hypothetical protein A3A38_04170 [Candidatus Kaiserbacteria bacterium RIFCSPLOWO2_01_FULL_53_17]|uniref:Polymer-forming cytoskeletal protein n=1 Tax=Candidatus Kaiserbacteria bacterium RIFCSPLOWO2_01_FULL_53_17 TaxID=1798511 RepID=A0A1F6EFU5_9BACT|nr:MAG: hypothetical protein A3A38_04170 [Candidatus Kaiserbacteria bacterium RIFCSPLOWO2_01_FULL_53_17]